MKRFQPYLILSMMCAVNAALAAPPSITSQHNGHAETIAAHMDAGSFTGFDLLVDGKVVAPVHFSSCGIIRASRVRLSHRGYNPEIAFEGLQGTPGSGLKLQNSSITVTLPTAEFPRVSFDIHIASFSPQQWKAKIGAQPFHFLTISMPSAKVWHHRGWLNATPLADPFPLLQDAHVNTPELSAFPYNREWSTTPPLSGHPLPIIGLWDPSPNSHLYVCWDFQETRVTQNSERDIATGFCNHIVTGKPPTSTLPDQPVSAEDRAGADKFIALVYPYGGQGYQQLVYPHAGNSLRSHCRLVYNRNLLPDQDPNRYLWSLWWHDPAIRSRLAHVPSLVDLSWIPDAMHLQSIPDSPGGSIISGVEGGFQVPGSRLISGWTWHNDSPVFAAAAKNDPAWQSSLEHDAAELMQSVKWLNIDGQKAAFWEKPLAGRWTDDWGGKAVTTLHNAGGWAAARLLLDLYKGSRNRSYLEVVDGVFNWTKQSVWTRNEFADVPSSPFAIGGTLAVSFLWDYYFTFKADADSAYRTRAIAARDMAVSYTYRYLNMWGSDSIRTDGLDPSFLWEPNSGRDWTGAACSNEFVWNIDTLAQTAVHSGDPVLLWALKGTASHWHEMFQDVFHPSLKDYTPQDMAEGYGLAPGNPYGYPGGHAPYGFGGGLVLLDPVGTSIVRVIAGEKAAIAFDRTTARTSISHYTCSAAGDFTVRLMSDAQQEFSATLTFPYADLVHTPIHVVSLTGENREVHAGAGLEVSAGSQWTVIVAGLRSGDMIVAGNGKPDGPDLRLSEALDAAVEIRAAVADRPFQFVTLSTGDPWNLDWKSLATTAGLSEGVHWANGVPFLLDHSKRQQLNGQKTPLVGVSAAAKTVYLLYLADSASQSPSVAPQVWLTNGEKVAPVASSALGWQAWPNALTARLLVAAYKSADGKRFAALSSGSDSGSTVFAITSSDVAPSTDVTVALNSASNQWKTLYASDKLASGLQALAAQIPVGSIAVIPPDASTSSAAKLLGKGGFLARARMLSPQQLVNPSEFSANRSPIALFLGGESYVNGVNRAGDGEDALKRYLDEGGTLVLLSGMPFPLYYALGPGDKAKPDPAMGRLGCPLDNSIEQNPTEHLTVHLIADQNIFVSLPKEFKYPDGDPRLRTVARSGITAGSTYVPIYHVTGASGKEYGDAAALVTLAASSNGKRGRIIYISNVLLRDPIAGPRITESVLKWLAAQHTH